MQRVIIGFVLCFIGLWAMGCSQADRISTAGIEDRKPAIEGPAFVLLYTDN